MKILKFGGTSVAAPDRVRSVVEIVAAARAEGPVAVVVSAFGGVTDELLAAARAAETGDTSFRDRLAALEARHRDAATELASDADREALTADLAEVHEELVRLLDGVCRLHEASPRTLDRVSGVGERVSAKCVAAALRAAGIGADAVDARDLIRTDDTFGNARVCEDATQERIRAHFDDVKNIQVVTGFVASTQDGLDTTLGRGGSDYTAAILGAALDAVEVEIWTDVDGVLSADPRVVRDAVLAERLSYDELMELSHFGAKVVYPPSVRPTRTRGIPLRIRNTFNPKGRGTLVTGDAEPIADDTPIVRGIASVPRVTLLRLEGAGMIGVPGIAMRLFGALARRDVSVILISQASSEHSICFAVAPEVAERAASAVDEEFGPERRAGLVDELVMESDLSVVAAVGAGMRERSGVSGRLFGVLGKHGVNVRAIAQGSSELNISLVVAAADEARTIRAIHDAFFMAGERTVDVYVAGVGRVGAALLAQLHDQADALLRTRRLRLRLAGIAVSRGALLDAAGLSPDEAEARVRSESDLVPLSDMVNAVRRDRGRDRVFVDCTAGDEVPRHYNDLLASGAAVVTANKRKLAASMAEWKELAAHRPMRLYHETTVGAALPVIGTARDLIATGDCIRSVEGVLSGTLAYLFNELAEGKRFSDVVKRANELGYTEPDPREDLGGRDVARKLLILARLAGRELEPEDIQVEPLLTDDWNDLSLDEFWKRLPERDAEMATQVESAEAAGRKLVYLATLDADGAQVGLREVEATHPAVGPGTDNLVAFRTDRYSQTPLVVRGPGAGPELTASGVFADILRAVAEGEAS